MQELKLSHISTSCAVRMLVRNLWMIVLAALTFSMAAGIYLNTLWTPQYRATMTYAVQGRTTSMHTSTSRAAAHEVTSALGSLLPTNMVTDKIRAWHPDLADFNGTISASQVGDSNLMVITCLDDTPDDALMALLALEEIFPEITSYLSTNSIAVMIRNPSVSGGMVNAVNVSAFRRKAALIGGAGMAALLIWFFLKRDTVQTRTGARNQLDANIITYVGRVRRQLSLRSLLRPVNTPLQVFSPTASFAYTEQIGAICTQLEHEHNTTGARLFLFTGVSENEGKSTISGNVAAALAMRGNRVAIVDCDLRNPSLNRFFDKKYTAAVPLNKMLGLPFSRDTLLQCMQRHEQLGIYMLFSHAPDRRCTELLTGPTMATVLTQLRVFDFVILDTPPMGYFADTEALVDSVDATMLVVRQDRTPACDINDAIDLLRRADSEFLGCILNDMTGSLTEGGGYGYGYGYGYGHYGHYGSHNHRNT